MKYRLLVIFLLTALFTGYGAKAQVSKAQAAKAGPDGAVSAKIRGNWALPDCRSYEEALIITPHFYLKSDKNGSSFWPVNTVRQLKDYAVISLEGKDHPVRVEADGVLKIGTLPATPKTWPKLWDTLGIDSRHEYMGCADIPALLPDPLVRAMQHIDKVEAACHASFSAVCKQALFESADANKDGKISAGEFKKAGMALAGIAALIENNTVDRDMLDRLTYQSMRESDRLMAGTGKKELRPADFNGFLEKTDSQPLLDALASISILVPGLQQK